jgi:hypothetical protein
MLKDKKWVKTDKSQLLRADMSFKKWERMSLSQVTDGKTYLQMEQMFKECTQSIL